MPNNSLTIFAIAVGRPHRAHCTIMKRLTSSGKKLGERLFGLVFFVNISNVCKQPLSRTAHT
jgi:hypothetical protein